jgi:hypothetical protein
MEMVFWVEVKKFQARAVLILKGVKENLKEALTISLK